MSPAERLAERELDCLPSPDGLDVVCEGDAETLVLSFPITSEPRVYESLTRAEREVVQGVLAGLPNHAIAQRRGVSPRTVANQIAHLFHKLRVDSRLALALALQHSARARRFAPGAVEQP